MRFITKHMMCAGPDARSLEAAIAEITETGASSLLILACDADGWTPEIIDPVLKRSTLPLFGGIFPSILKQSNCYNNGTLILGLSVTADVFLVRDISGSLDALEHSLDEIAPHLLRAKTLFTIVDGLSKSVERLVENLFYTVGAQPSTFGCCAGSLELVQKACLFSNEGLVADAALIVGLPRFHFSSVSHGWEILDGPYLVTGAQGNKLDSLNYLPAFDVYREQLESNTEFRFGSNDFFSITKIHPLGIANACGEILVRDPLYISGKSLVCVGDIPPFSSVYLLKGDESSLIASSAEAAQWVKKAHYNSHHDRDSNTTLLFDCVSRSLFLEGAFKHELQEICDQLGEGEIFGTLSLGEISNSRKGPIELLNKAAVVAMF